MIKFIKFVLGTLLILVLIVIAGSVIFLKVVGPGYFKPQIIAASEKALGRTVGFNDISLGLSLRKGIQVHLTDVAVGENPDFGSGNFLTAKGLDFAVSVKDLLKKKINVLSVDAQSPAFTIVRLKDGRVNVQSFGKAASQKPSAGAAAAPAIAINSANIADGQLTYNDNLLQPPVSLKFTHILANASDINLINSFPLKASAAFASDKPNITLTGQGRIDTAKASFSLTNAVVNSDLSSLSMETVRQSVPQLQKAPAFEIKAGELTANIQLFEAGQGGLRALKSEASLKAGQLSLKNISTSIDAALTATESAITIDEATCAIGTGSVKLNAKIDDYMGKQDFDSNIIIESVDVADLLDQSTREIKMKGLLSGKANIKGQGFATDTLLANLKGSGELAVKQATLSNINVLKAVLDKISFVPGLPELLEQKLPEAFKERLTKKDTVVTDSSMSFTLADKLINIQPMAVTAEGFSFNGNGTVGFDRKYNFDGTFAIPQDLSSEMVTAVAQLQALLNNSQQIQFPLKISGQGSSVSFVPDVVAMGASAIESKVSEQLDKTLKSIFEKDNQQTNTAPSQGTLQQQNQKRGRRTK